jgi:NDP-sugar pyrophosphorylase family protein
MIKIKNWIHNFPSWLGQEDKTPWEIIGDLENLLKKQIRTLGKDYNISNGVAVHKNAIVEQGVVLKGNIIISENCIIGANAYLRGPIFLGSTVKIGPGCEIKQSIILDETATAHFNYVGNSIIGTKVNFEAGSICANHFNERVDKHIFVFYKGKLIDTKSEKFGSLVGDHCKIGANAVLSPGTLLEKESIVKRLELVSQVINEN